MPLNLSDMLNKKINYVSNRTFVGTIFSSSVLMGVLIVLVIYLLAWIAGNKFSFKHTIYISVVVVAFIALHDICVNSRRKEKEMSKNDTLTYAEGGGIYAPLGGGHGDTQPREIHQFRDSYYGGRPTIPTQPIPQLPQPHPSIAPTADNLSYLL